MDVLDISHTIKKSSPDGRTVDEPVCFFAGCSERLIRDVFVESFLKGLCMFDRNDRQTIVGFLSFHKNFTSFVYVRL